ncbi:MAG TPA: PIN domain-containing protein [Acidimicrobiales bacterium]|nr:PIN domain-containing protein [Acidimicrobiales bacterium]
MFVEITRLLIVLATMALGGVIGHRAGSPNPALAGAVLGACFGYVIGGIGARLVRAGLNLAQKRLEETAPARFLAGLLGAAAVGGLGAVLGLPALLGLPRTVALPVFLLLVWLGAAGGYGLAASKSVELLAMAGLSTRPLVRATPYGGEGDAVLVDTSAVIDGRLLPLARSGFLTGPLLVPCFVVDEVQLIADSADPARRRRGRRGLEILEALRHLHVPVHVLEDEMVEVEAVDAKLVALARRLRVGLLTLDHALQKVAELQGVRCPNLDGLAEGLRPSYVAGEPLRLMIERPGREPGQGVGFLEDGSMVVVADAAGHVGTQVAVRVTGQVQTSMGRMLFASLVGEEIATG